MNQLNEEAVVLVTGGASGIGAACVRMAARRGATVAVTDVDLEGAKAVAADVRRHGGKADAFRMDVRSEKDVEATVAEIETVIGPVTGCVASAGILQVPLPPEELPMSVYDDVIAVDQRGVYLTCLAVGRRMAARGSGAIVTIASIAGMRSMPLHPYAQAKAAVISMTESLAAEWGRSGVRINAVCPGYTLTPALKAAIDDGKRDPTLLEENAALGRLVTPDEIAEGVVFLLSDSARAITGISLPVDAGWLVATSWHTYGGLRPKRGNADA